MASRDGILLDDNVNDAFNDATVVRGDVGSGVGTVAAADGDVGGLATNTNGDTGDDNDDTGHALYHASIYAANDGAVRAILSTLRKNGIAVQPIRTSNND